MFVRPPLAQSEQRLENGHPVFGVYFLRSKMTDSRHRPGFIGRANDRRPSRPAAGLRAQIQCGAADASLCSLARAAYISASFSGPGYSPFQS